MSRTFLFPYNPSSRSARALSSNLDIQRIRHRRSRYIARNSDTIINWGSTQCLFVGPNIINNPNNVNTASNKLLFFAKSDDAETFRTPTYTTDKEVAKEWPQCVSRTLTRASSGRGIVITQEGETPPDAPLYVRYVKKQVEYRIHVAFGSIIDMQHRS